MSNLTEKWKAGELEDRFYYTQTGKDKITAIDIYDKESNIWLLNSDKDFPSFEVLAPVPSYYEFDALKMNCEFIHRCLDDSRKKNTELMKLLKECSEYMTFRYSSKKTLELLTKINEVLR